MVVRRQGRQPWWELGCTVLRMSANCDGSFGMGDSSLGHQTSLAGGPMLPLPMMHWISPVATRCQHWWEAQVNEFEQVSSRGHQISLEGVPCGHDPWCIGPHCAGTPLPPTPHGSWHGTSLSVQGTPQLQPQPPSPSTLCGHGTSLYRDPSFWWHGDLFKLEDPSPTSTDIW